VHGTDDLASECPPGPADRLLVRRSLHLVQARHGTDPWEPGRAAV